MCESWSITRMDSPRNVGAAPARNEESTVSFSGSPLGWKRERDQGRCCHLDRRRSTCKSMSRPGRHMPCYNTIEMATTDLGPAGRRVESEWRYTGVATSHCGIRSPGTTSTCMLQGLVLRLIVVAFTSRRRQTGPSRTALVGEALLLVIVCKSFVNR